MGGAQYGGSLQLSKKTGSMATVAAKMCSLAFEKDEKMLEDLSASKTLSSQHECISEDVKIPTSKGVLKWEPQMYFKDFCAIISPPQNYVFSNVCFQQSWESAN